jgi:hypothetical protein
MFFSQGNREERCGNDDKGKNEQPIDKERDDQMHESGARLQANVF